PTSSSTSPATTPTASTRSRPPGWPTPAAAPAVSASARGRPGWWRWPDSEPCPPVRPAPWPLTPPPLTRRRRPPSAGGRRAPHAHGGGVGRAGAPRPTRVLGAGLRRRGRCRDEPSRARLPEVARVATDRSGRRLHRPPAQHAGPAVGRPVHLGRPDGGRS